MIDDQTVIDSTKLWLNKVVIDLNICPFAANEVRRDSIAYRVFSELGLADALHSVIDQCLIMDNESAVETTLLIFVNDFTDFDVYMDFVELANQLIVDQGYEGQYQLASFHPDYCFAEEATDDPANFTNRSPYAMLHILRENSLEKALQQYPEPEAIPENNIKSTRQLGYQHMLALLKSCYR